MAGLSDIQVVEVWGILLILAVYETRASQQNVVPVKGHAFET